MKIALLSDIHAVTDDDDSDSNSLRMGSDRMSETHPFEALSELFRKESLKVDLLMCAGDLGTKSDPKTIEFTWNELNKIKNEFKIPNLIATPGNHDHDSRSKYSEYDPRGFLQTLNPIFPCDFGDQNSHFWAWNIDITSVDCANILVLNSSAHHGISQEFLHGRVTEITINKALEKVRKVDSKPINILLCHHHIQKQEDINISEYDAMHGGEKLIRQLTSAHNYDWMIIHGHKHYPKISYASNETGQSIPIFSAGSFSGDIRGNLGSRVANQFYLIDFEVENFEKFGLVGQISAWDWAYGRGWVKASNNSGIPHKTGFGYQFQIRTVLRDLKKLKENSYQSEDLLLEIPYLKFITYTGLNQIKKASEEAKLFEFDIVSGTIKTISKIVEN